MEKLRVLFVIGNASQMVGGHILSSITIAGYFQKRGHQVGLLLAPLKVAIPELKSCTFQIHSIPCLPGLGALISRPFDISRLVRECKYDAVVAMDWYAGMYAGLAAFLFKKPVVQVIAGGVGPKSSPVNLPGIIVFSEELVEIIPSKFNIERENLILSPGRIDFETYKLKTEINNTIPLGFNVHSTRILAISRLNSSKAPAISALLKQLELVDREKSVQCVIIGNGEARENLEKEAADIFANVTNETKIHFVGEIRVGASHLQQADLVIGQGRTVLEAIASGVPAAVCGNDGYFGLITKETLPPLASTNLTGRQLNPFTSLLQDIDGLHYYNECQIDEVYDLAYQMYDASLGALAVEQAIKMVKNYFESKKISRFKVMLIWGEAWYKGLLTLGKRRLLNVAQGKNEK